MLQLLQVQPCPMPVQLHLKFLLDGRLVLVRVLEGHLSGQQLPILLIIFDEQRIARWWVDFQ